MSLSDPLGDMLTRIRNGQRAGKPAGGKPGIEGCGSTCSTCSKREGYIRDYSTEEIRTGIGLVKIELKYAEGRPVIRKIDRVSKPGRRVYSKVSDLPRVYNGLGISILSTPRGVMSDSEARAANVGGEVLCQVF